METKSIVLFVVLAIAALFVLDLVSSPESITGRASETDRGKKSCSDTDGFDVYSKGFVTTFIGGQEKQYPDRCSGGDGLRVLENYCEGDRRAFTYEWCNDGEFCSDGACKRSTTTNYYGS